MTEKKDFDDAVRAFIASVYSILASCSKGCIVRSATYCLAKRGYFPSDEQISKWLSNPSRNLLTILEEVSSYRDFKPFSSSPKESDEGYIRRLYNIYADEESSYNDAAMNIMTAYNTATEASSQAGVPLIRDEVHLRDLEYIRDNLAPDDFFKALLGAN